MSTNDLFNWDVLRKVPDPSDSPTVFPQTELGKQRLHYQKITENPDHLGMMHAMVAAASGLHPEIRVGAIAYDAWNKVFGPAACNHLNAEGESVQGKFSPYLVTGPLDKHYTECAEIRAIRHAAFLKVDSSKIAWTNYPSAWVLYTTRLPCKRCRGFVAKAKPMEIVVHQQATDWLLANKRGYQEEVTDTRAFFAKSQIRIRQVDLPTDFLVRLFAEIAGGIPYGVPNRRRWRSPEKRAKP